jgi:zinc protease
LFIAYAFLTPGPDHKIIEEIILNEYINILENGVSDKEIKRAQAQIRATVAFSRDGTYAVASALNEAIAIGDWTFYTNFMNNINMVSVERIKEVIKKYFIEDQSTTGWFIAKEPKD